MPSRTRPPIEIGERIGRWVVIADAGRDRWRHRRWEVRCDCGTVAIRSEGNLRSGRARSCGCARNEMTAERAATHGHARVGARSPTYASWTAMKSRCLNPARRSHKDYGGRGITICDRWLGPGGFENFLADMGERPEGRTLDRIDVDGNYEPDNCRWATPKEQEQTRRAPSGRPDQPRGGDGRFIPGGGLYRRRAAQAVANGGGA